MKTLVIGGTGFLGAYIVDELLANAQPVAVLTRNPDRARQEMPAGVEIIEGDLAGLDQDALTSMLTPFSKLVFAAGVDERLRPDTDCLLYTSPSPRDGLLSRMPSSA